MATTKQGVTHTKTVTWRYANHDVRITVEVSDGFDDEFAAFFAETLRGECAEALGRFRVGMSSITIVADDRETRDVRPDA